jgi:hypothetical protein
LAAVVISVHSVRGEPYIVIGQPIAVQHGDFKASKSKNRFVERGSGISSTRGPYSTFGDAGRGG